MKKKKASELNVPADMSDEAIERRWKTVAQLYELGMAMRSAKLTGRKARDHRRGE